VVDSAPGHAILDAARLCARRGIPIVVYSPSPQSRRADALVAKLTTVTPIRRVQSLERLLDQTVMILHVPVGELLPEKRETIESLYESKLVLAGKKVLVVDDDIRNIFALTSVLERQNMEVLSAETGQEAIRRSSACRDRHRAHGRDDAGHGRVRHDARDSQEARFKDLRSSRVRPRP
jgi:hypothetical protein